jgi:segregation and condensation protein A
MQYKIKIPDFEGPFDLLLYFIKKDELNIYDIPIARITEEFLNYIQIMKFFDLELAGEFILMASTLMYIKSQMLLPRELPNDDGEIEDPRQQLVQRLIEYKQFKAASQELMALSEESRYIYYRQIFEQDRLIAENSIGKKFVNATLFDLINAFRKALSKSDITPPSHIINLIPLTVDDRMNYLTEKLKHKNMLSFIEITNGETRQNIIITFLAILELIKMQEIFIRQSDIFDDIIITSKPEYNLN